MRYGNLSFASLEKADGPLSSGEWLMTLLMSTLSFRLSHALMVVPCPNVAFLWSPCCIYIPSSSILALGSFPLSFYPPSAFLLHFHLYSYCRSLFLPFSFNYLPTSSILPHFLCFLSFHIHAFPGVPIPCLSAPSLPGPFHLNVALSYYTFLPPSYFYLLF